MGNKIKFLILTYPRCGTHLLQTSLSVHTNIHVLGELYGQILKFRKNPEDFKEKSVKDFYNKYYAFNKSNINARGFILHRIRHDDEEFTKLLVNDNDIKIIYLNRDNLLKRFLSEEVSIQTKKWRYHRSNNDKIIGFDEFKFKGKKFLKNIKLYNDGNDRYLELFKDHQIYKSTYELLTSDYTNELNRVQKFLNLPIETLKPDTEKIMKKPMSEYITNYNEMVEFLIHNKLEHYLNETIENNIK